MIKKADIRDLNKILELNKKLFEFEKQFGDTFNLDWTYSLKGKNYFKKIFLNTIFLNLKLTSKNLCSFPPKTPPELETVNLVAESLIYLFASDFIHTGAANGTFPF